MSSLKDRYREWLKKNRNLTIVLTIIILFFLVALLAPRAEAGTATLSGCTPPTERSDNTPLNASEIQGYNWYINGQQEGTTTDCQAGTRITTSQPDGDYTVEATTVDVNGLESITLSNAIIKSFTTAAPLPPTIQ